MVSNSRGIYIAAAKPDAEIAKHYMRLARSIGFIVSFDWTDDVLPYANKEDSSLAATERVALAVKDSRAVERADLFWLLAPEKETVSRGSMFEFGLARALRKTTIVSGPGRADCIFFELASVQYQTHEAAFEALKSWPK